MKSSIQEFRERLGQSLMSVFLMGPETDALLETTR